MPRSTVSTATALALATTVVSAGARLSWGPRMVMVSEGSSIEGSSTTQPWLARISAAEAPTRNRCCRLGTEKLSVWRVDFCRRTEDRRTASEPIRFVNARKGKREGPPHKLGVSVPNGLDDFGNGRLLALDDNAEVALLLLAAAVGADDSRLVELGLARGGGGLGLVRLEDRRRRDRNLDVTVLLERRDLGLKRARSRQTCQSAGDEGAGARKGEREGTGNPRR
jgi:hypothetical protein